MEAVRESSEVKEVSMSKYRAASFTESQLYLRYPEKVTLEVKEAVSAETVR